MSTLLEKFELFRRVLHDRRTTKSEIRVLFEIILLLNPRRGDQAWPSYEYLVARVGMAERNIRKSVASLVRDKILVLQPGGRGAGSTNHYSLSPRILSAIRAERERNKGDDTHPNKGDDPHPPTTTTDKSKSTYRANARQHTPLRRSEKPSRVAERFSSPVPVQNRKLALTEVNHMSHAVRAELNEELDELLDYMLPVYNSSHSGAPLDMSKTPDGGGRFIFSKDRGRVWGAYMYARVDYLFSALRAAVEEHYENQAVIEHPAVWLMYRHWLPADQRPKVVRFPGAAARGAARG